MATSYANPGGTGNRTGIITATTNLNLAAASDRLINGSFADSTAGSTYFFSGNSGSGKWFRWDFGLNGNRLIDEFKWYQNTSQGHGTWSFQGSNDATTWTTLATFTLGVPATQTVAFSNSTYYRYYQLVTAGATTSGSPWLREIEFKLEGMPTVSKPRVSQFGVISIQQSPPISPRVSQFAIISIVGDGRKTIRLGSPIGLDCWQPCTAYGTTGLIVYL